MGCGASAARAVESPLSPLSSKPQEGGPHAAEPAVDSPGELAAALVSTHSSTPAHASPRPAKQQEDDLEGLLAALEEKAGAKGSTRSGADPVRQAASGPKGEAADLEQLLSELEAPRHSSSPGNKSVTLAKQASLQGAAQSDGGLIKPQGANTRQLAPLKISGRVPGAMLTLPPAPPQNTLPALQKIPRSGTWKSGSGDSWEREVEQPDSAMLLTLDHHKLGLNHFSRTSSTSSPSTAATTYITFDLAAEEYLHERGGEPYQHGVEDQDEKDGYLQGVATQGWGGVGLWGGDLMNYKRVLEKKAAEVDELLRNVFEDEGGGKQAGASPLVAESGRLRGGGEGEPREERKGTRLGYTQKRNGLKSSEDVEDLWRSIQAGTLAAGEGGGKDDGVGPAPSQRNGEPAPIPSHERGASNGRASSQTPSKDSVRKEGSMAGVEADYGSEGESSGREREKVLSGADLRHPRGSRQPAPDILDLDDLEVFAREEDARSQEQDFYNGGHGSSVKGPRAIFISVGSQNGRENDTRQGPSGRSSNSDQASTWDSERFDRTEPMEDLLFLDSADLEDEGD